MNEADGQLHTLSVLEPLRDASKGLWGASSEAYFRVDELLVVAARKGVSFFDATCSLVQRRWGTIWSRF
jgi:hypothetical protein